MTDTFTASVESFVETSLLFHTAVLKQSAQDFGEDAQRPTGKGGRMRVDTGFLRNSHVSGLNGSTSMSGPDSYVLTIAQMKLGDILNGGWTADYAVHREFGARGQAPDFFARGAAQKWQSFVDKNAAKLKGMIR
jgi:hypothetical protein